MKLTLKSTLSATGLLVGGFLGASALMVMAAGGTWTGAPTCTSANMPCNNVAAPVNVGDAAQVKTGLLSLGNFQFVPPTMPATGTAGKVLVATDDAGTVGWGASSGGAGVTSGGTSDNHWFQIGNMLIVGGISYPGTLKSPNIVFSKPFSSVTTIQFTSLDNRSTNQQVHPEDNVKVFSLTNTGFSARTTNNNGFSWLAIGTI